MQWGRIAGSGIHIWQNSVIETEGRKEGSDCMRREERWHWCISWRSSTRNKTVRLWIYCCACGRPPYRMWWWSFIGWATKSRVGKRFQSARSRKLYKSKVSLREARWDIYSILGSERVDTLMWKRQMETPNESVKGCLADWRAGVLKDWERRDFLFQIQSIQRSLTNLQ